MRLSILGSLIVWAIASTALAQEVVREFSWSELKKTGQLTAGEIQPGVRAGQHEQLKIDNPSDEPKTVTLLDLENPGVTAFQYAIEGSVRYENVKGKGYLEMWSWFAGGGRYFTRTMNDSGPMQSLEGSSDWRPSTLPFFISKAKGGFPKRIVVNVVFAGRGTVYLSPVKLFQYHDTKELQYLLGMPVSLPLSLPPSSAGNLPQSSVGWWGARTDGLIGGIGGSIVGFLGGIIGALAGCGKARRFVLTLTAVLMGLGVISFIGGMLILARGRPYDAMYSSLLLFGVVITTVCGGLLLVLRHRYEQIELRKMAAMDSR